MSEWFVSLQLPKLPTETSEAPYSLNRKVKMIAKWSTWPSGVRQLYFCTSLLHLLMAKSSSDDCTAYSQRSLSIGCGICIPMSPTKVLHKVLKQCQVTHVSANENAVTVSLFSTYAVEKKVSKTLFKKSPFPQHPDVCLWVASAGVYQSQLEDKIVKQDRSHPFFIFLISMFYQSCNTW